MGRFTVLLTSEPATRTPEDKRIIRLSFARPNGAIDDVTLSEVIVPEGEKKGVPVGFRFLVQVDADDIDAAIKYAGEFADAIASFVTLVTGVGLPLVRPWLAYESSLQSENRAFLQFFDLPHQVSRGTLNVQAFKDLIDRVFQAAEDKEIHDRVARAIRWYRVGVLSSDRFDRFNSFWIGLEALNPLLQRKLKVDDDSQTCPCCRHQWVAMPTVSGIREFFHRNLSDGKNTYKDVKKLRNDLMHAHNELAPLEEKASQLNFKLAKALNAAIRFCLGMSPPWNLPKELISNAAPLRIAVAATLHCSKLEDCFPSDGKQPHLEPSTGEVIRFERLSDGKIRLYTRSDFKLIIGPCARMTFHGWQLYGEGPDVTVDEVTK